MPGVRYEALLLFNVPHERLRYALREHRNKHAHRDKAVILEGSPLSSDNDVPLTYNYARAQGLSVGDIITLAGRNLSICGLCVKPDYAAMYENMDDSFPNSTDFGIALITGNAMNSIGGFSSYYSVKFLDPEREADFRAAVYSRYGTLEYVGKSANPSADEFNVIISENPLNIPAELLRKSASLEDYRRSTESALNTARIVLSIVKVVGALICILVVILLSGMLIEENRRSISTLEVLGYRGQEIRRLILSSNHLLVPVGFALGIPLGLALGDMIARASAASGGILMSITLTGKTLLVSAAFIVVSYVLPLALSARKLKKVDMVECLKEERE